jgi:hypothetical protein
MEENQQAVNDLDGYNGNHGDNMVQNLRTITTALAEQQQAPPAEALRYASRELQTRGKGGTSAYYVKGLDQAAERLEGRPELSRGDVMTLVQSLLGAVPSEGHAPQPSAGGSVFEQVIGLAANQQSQANQGGGPGAPGGLGAPGGAGAPDALMQALFQAQQAQGPSGGQDSPLQGLLGAQQEQDDDNPLGGMLGALLGASAPEPQGSPGSLFGGGGQPQGGPDALGGLLGALLGGQQAPQSMGAPESPLSALLGGQQQQQGGDNPLGGLLGALLGGQPQQQGMQGDNRPANLIQTLLPAAMAYLQAKQSGAETSEALMSALLGLLTNRRMNPLAAGTPRSAAGGLLAQSMLQALAG